MRRLRFGFVVYGFSYEESDTEWKTSLEKLNEGLGSRWEDVVGSEKIRGKATLRCIMEGRRILAKKTLLLLGVSAGLLLTDPSNFIGQPV
jgi:hypothetical protein